MLIFLFPPRCVHAGPVTFAHAVILLSLSRHYYDEMEKVGRRNDVCVCVCLYPGVINILHPRNFSSRKGLFSRDTLSPRDILAATYKIGSYRRTYVSLRALPVKKSIVTTTKGKRNLELRLKKKTCDNNIFIFSGSILIKFMKSTLEINRYKREY